MVERQRRSSEEVRSLLVEAARELFAQRGYAGTGTREISARAGVAESLLFKQFGSKAALFEAAVVAPLSGFFDAYVREWERHEIGSSSIWELCEKFASSFFELLREQRELVMALVTAQRFDRGVPEDGEPGRMLRRALEKMDYLTVVEGRGRIREIDMPITVRLAVGMVMSVALLDEWLFPGGVDTFPRERLVRELAMFMMTGISSDSCCETRAQVTARRSQAEATFGPRPPDQRRPLDIRRESLG